MKKFWIVAKIDCGCYYEVSSDLLLISCESQDEKDRTVARLETGDHARSSCSGRGETKVEEILVFDSAPVIAKYKINQIVAAEL
jgi:hypothetical protein